MQKVFHWLFKLVTGIEKFVVEGWMVLCGDVAAEGSNLIHNLGDGNGPVA